MDRANSDGARERRSDRWIERQSNGSMERRRDGATKYCSNRATERRSNGATKQRFCEDYSVSAKSKTLGKMCRGFLMLLTSDFCRNIKRKARFVVSLGMHWMEWRSYDDETDLWNFGDFGHFVRMRRK